MKNFRKLAQKRKQKVEECLFDILATMHYIFIMIFPMDNLLIDATAEVDESFLKKWRLIKDNAIIVDESYHELIDEIVKSDKTQKTPGGATQNVLSMAQLFIQDQGETAIVGSVGNDSNRKVLEKFLQSVV